jgi:predicted RNA methylase
MEPFDSQFIPWEDVIEEDLNKILDQYEIDKEKARALFIQNLKNQNLLTQKLETEERVRHIKKHRAYKSALKETKKEIYYLLRRYHQDIEAEQQWVEALKQNPDSTVEELIQSQIIKELLGCHVSTKERFPDTHHFFKELFEIIPPPQKVLDLGCGLFPLCYPLHIHPPKIYIAVDKDPAAIYILQLFKEKTQASFLYPVQADLSEKRWEQMIVKAVPHLDTVSTSEFDLCFLLKLIPVLKRRDPTALNNLLTFSFHNIAISASLKSLTKKKVRNRRDIPVVLDFIEENRLNMQNEFLLDNEKVFICGS